MQGKKLTKEEKKDRCNYCLSKVLKFNADELITDDFTFIKRNIDSVEKYSFKKNRAVNMKEFHKKWRHRTALVEESYD
mgnify:CR=1 FL=1